MTTRLPSGLALILSLSLGALAACGGGGGSSVTTHILADQGGTVALDGDETSLEIPANALAADTDISLSIGSLADYAALEGGRDRVAIIDPAGTTLAIDATITLDPGSPAVTAEHIISIAQFTDGVWIVRNEAAPELHSGGLVTASIDVLLPTAVIVRDPPIGPTGSIDGMVLHLYTEAPLPGIVFELRSSGQVIGTATSDANGLFGFDAVPVGSYQVHAVVTADQNCYNDPVDKDAAVTENMATSVFFGFVPGPCG